MLFKNKKYQKVEDRETKMGDLVEFNFSGRVKEEEFPFPGGTAERYKLVLGSKQFIPGFEEEMVGKNIGEEFQFELSFPENYHAGNLAGKNTVWTIYIHSISEKA